MRFVTRDDIRSFEDMVAFLTSEGVDTNFEDKEKWVESPEKLYKKLREGEVKFGRHPERPQEFSSWRACSRVLMCTSEERFVQIYKKYKDGKIVRLLDDGPTTVESMFRSQASTLIETAKPGETSIETAVRGVLEELGISILPSVLVLRPTEGAHLVGLDWIGLSPLRDTYPSTVFPFWSTVESFDFHWPIAQRHGRIKEGVFRHDEDVEIYREWRPW